MPVNKQMPGGRSGFTLVEMAIAIAMASFILVTIWSLIGTAQSTLGSATGKATRARIAQQIFGEILLSEWTTVGEYHNRDFYYDSEGLPVEESESEEGESSFWAYRANVEISDKQPEVPGVEMENETNREEDGPPAISRRVVVRITHGAFEDYDFEQDNRHAVYTTWVSKMDKM